MFEINFDKQKKYYKSHITKTYEFRIEMLKKLKKALIKYEFEIANALYKDLRKGIVEVYTSEIGFVLNEINETMKNLKKWMKREKVRGDLLTFGSKSYIYKEPYGTSLIIGTWNYPINLTLGPLVGAIAGGNVAIVKPSEVSCHTALVIEKLIKETFDSEYIFCVVGGVEEVSNLLNLPFDKIFFTGAPNIGKIVMEKASKHLSNLTLELGGKSPCIVHKDAKLVRSIKRIINGKLINNGQTCVAPDYLLVHKEIKDDFIKSFDEEIKKIFGKKIIDFPHLTRIINQKHFKRLMSYLHGENILLGGEGVEEELYISPTLVEIDNFNNKLMTEEIFGPILPIYIYEDLVEVEEIIEKNPNPLAFYAFGHSKDLVDLVEKIPFGGGCINDTINHMLNKNLPFGGRGTSGLGAYHGKDTFNAFTHRKSVLVNKMPIEFKEKILFTDKYKNLIKKFMIK